MDGRIFSLPFQEAPKVSLLLSPFAQKNLQFGKKCFSFVKQGPPFGIPVPPLRKPGPKFGEPGPPLRKPGPKFEEPGPLFERPAMTPLLNF